MLRTHLKRFSTFCYQDPFLLHLSHLKRPFYMKTHKKFFFIFIIVMRRHI